MSSIHTMIAPLFPPNTVTSSVLLPAIPNSPYRHLPILIACGGSALRVYVVAKEEDRTVLVLRCMHQLLENVSTVRVLNEHDPKPSQTIPILLSFATPMPQLSLLSLHSVSFTIKTSSLIDLSSIHLAESRGGSTNFPSSAAINTDNTTAGGGGSVANYLSNDPMDLTEDRSGTLAIVTGGGVCVVLVPYTICPSGSTRISNRMPKVVDLRAVHDQLRGRTLLGHSGGTRVKIPEMKKETNKEEGEGEDGPGKKMTSDDHATVTMAYNNGLSTQSTRLSTGFGPIVQATYLPNTPYEAHPVLALLHFPGGRIGAERLPDSRCEDPTCITKGEDLTGEVKPKKSRQKKGIIDKPPRGYGSLTAISVDSNNMNCQCPVWTTGSTLPVDARGVVIVPNGGLSGGVGSVSGSGSRQIAAIALVVSDSMLTLIGPPSGSSSIAPILSRLAFNGYADSTIPPCLDFGGLTRREFYKQFLNPAPLPKLGFSFHNGSVALFKSGGGGLLTTFDGSVYMLSFSEREKSEGEIVMSVSSIRAQLPSPTPANTSQGSNNELFYGGLNLVESYPGADNGLMFVGTDTGNSALFRYDLRKIDLTRTKGGKKDLIKEMEQGVLDAVMLLSKKRKRDDIALDEYSMQLEKEEEELYGHEDNVGGGGEGVGKNKSALVVDSSRQTHAKADRTLLSFTTVEFEHLDTLTQLGPLGPGCIGATAMPAYDNEAQFANSSGGGDGDGLTDEDDSKQIVEMGREMIHPCGLGREGGIVVLSSPGAGTSTQITAQIDVNRVVQVLSAPKLNVSFLTRRSGDGGAIALDLVHRKEVDLSSLTADKSLLELFTNSELLGLQTTASNDSITLVFDTALVTGTIKGKKVTHVSSSKLTRPIKKVSLNECLGKITTGLVFENGEASINDRAIQNDKIDPVATMDVFVAPSTLFSAGDDEGSFDLDGDEEKEHFFSNESASFGVGDVSDINASTFVGVCRASGVLEVFSASAPVFDSTTCLWRSTSKNINDSPRFLFSEQKQGVTTIDSSSGVPLAKEISFFVAGAVNTGISELRSFYLVVCTGHGDLVLYCAKKSSGHDVVFTRVNVDVITRMTKAVERFAMRMKAKHGEGTGEGEVFQYQPPLLNRFKNISGHSGVFVSGARPCWIVNERGAAILLPHKMRHVAPGQPRPLTSFCESIDDDFITLHQRCGVDAGGEQQRLTFFRSLDDVLQTDGLLPGGGLCARKVILGVSVLKVEFVSAPEVSSNEHPLYVLLVSVEQPRDMSAERDNSGTIFETEENRWKKKQEKNINRLERAIDSDLQGHDNDIAWMKDLAYDQYLDCNPHTGTAPLLPLTKHQIWLVSANKWEVIQKLPLEKYEIGNCLKVLHLSEAETEDEKKNREERGIKQRAPQLFVAVGSGFMEEEGEEVNGRGRIIFFGFRQPEEIVKVKADRAETERLDRLKEDANEAEYDREGEEEENQRKRDRLAERRRKEDEEREENERSCEWPAVDHPGLTKKRLCLLYEKDYYGTPVNTIDVLTYSVENPLLVVGAGAELMIEKLHDGQLVQVGFYHAAMHILDVVIFKNFITMIDAYMGITLLVWAKKGTVDSLTELSRNFDPSITYAGGIVQRGAKVAFVLHDDRANLQMLEYSPNDPASRGGNKLISTGDVHAGATTTSFTSYYLQSSLTANSATSTITFENLKKSKKDIPRLYGLAFPTLDGGYNSVIPVDDKTFFSLLGLQTAMSNALDIVGGLSAMTAKTFRADLSRHSSKRPASKNVLDGQLLLEFARLDRSFQIDLSRSMGLSVDNILDAIAEINYYILPLN